MGTGVVSRAYRWASIVGKCCIAIAISHLAEAAPPMVQQGNTSEIADGVYVIPNQGTALVPNIGIVVGNESVLVIDTGMGPQNAQTVMAEVRRISDLPVRYLTSTHFHPEHIFGAQAFPDDTLFVSSDSQRHDLQNKGERYREWFIEMFGDDVRHLLEPVILIPPDITFQKSVELQLGGMRALLMHFGEPAHTGGDTVIFLPQQRITFAGGLVPNGTFPILPDADSSIRGWVATLELLENLGAETIVPGHGPVGDATLIDTVRGYLTAVQEQAVELQSQGATLQEAQESLFTKFTERYPEWEEPNWITTAVAEAYSEARHGRTD